MADSTPEENLFETSETFMFLALAGGFFGGMALLTGLILAFATGFSGSGSVGTYIFLGACFPLCALPGGVCLAIGLILRKRARRLKDIADMLKAYRRMKVAELARKMGENEFEMEKAIIRCIDLGLVQGHFDRHTGEFFTPEALIQEMKIRNCPHCKAPVDKVVLVGERIECSYCKGAIGSGPERPSGGIGP